jgi:hypothetical protein
MRLWILLLVLFQAGCNSVTFVQYEQEGEQRKTKHWHHGTLNGLVEISRPLNLNDICNGKAWNTVKTEVTFWNGLVASLVPTKGLSLYTPWTNEVECFQTPLSRDNSESGNNTSG